MQSIPNAPIELKEGTLACSSANPDFRKYFNWMAATLLNAMTSPDVKAGKHGIKIDMTIQDNPKIKVVYV